MRIGDKVRIKKNIQEVRRQGGSRRLCHGVHPDMRKFEGATATLVRPEGNYNNWIIDEDGREFLWHEDWFEPLVSFKNIEKII